MKTHIAHRRTFAPAATAGLLGLTRLLPGPEGLRAVG